MKHYSVKPVRLAVQPSRRLLSLLVLAGIGACLLVGLLPMPRWLKLVLGAGILLQVAYYIARDVLLRLPWSITALELSSEGVMRCMTCAGNWTDAAVLGDSFVAPWLTVLNLRLPERRFSRHVVMLPDAVDAEAYRRLRVWLRWGSQALPDEA